MAFKVQVPPWGGHPAGRLHASPGPTGPGNHHPRLAWLPTVLSSGDMAQAPREGGSLSPRSGVGLCSVQTTSHALTPAGSQEGKAARHSVFVLRVLGFIRTLAWAGLAAQTPATWNLCCRVCVSFLSVPWLHNYMLGNFKLDTMISKCMNANALIYIFTFSKLSNIFVSGFLHTLKND